MLINKKIVFTLAVGLALSVSSCKKFLDVNTNPNISQTATVQTLLPAAQLYLGSSVGVELQIYGSFWAQYWTQSPNASQYIAVDQYATGQDAFSTSWTNLYAGAENFFQLYNLADTQKKKQYKAISLLMQAYTFQVITDGWGDVPFKQALKGQYIDGHLVNPKYDSQLVVYKGILAYIDTARKLISAADPIHPSTDDIIYGGNMTKWGKFANTLRLKVLMRMSNIDPTGTRTKIDSFFRAVPAPQFIGEGDDAVIAYGFSSANKSPLYAEASSTTLAGTQNLVGSKTCIDSMNSNNDYRAYVFYEATSAGVPVGIAQSQYNVSLPSSSYSIPNVYVAGDASNSASANAPVNLLTSWESYFLQAEAVARGYTTMASASDDVLFYKGIHASFAYYNSQMSNEIGVDSAVAYDVYVNGDATIPLAPGYWAVYPTTGTVAEKVRHIITQKWFAMCGNQGFEAWTEWRRTGYPDFLVHPVNSLIGNNRPLRFLYPTSETTTNGNFPSTGLLPLTSSVWWDK